MTVDDFVGVIDLGCGVVMLRDDTFRDMSFECRGNDVKTTTPSLEIVGEMDLDISELDDDNNEGVADGMEVNKVESGINVDGLKISVDILLPILLSFESTVDGEPTMVGLVGVTDDTGL